MKRRALAVSGELALRADFSIGRAVASAADLSIGARCTVAVCHTERTALRVGALTARTTLGVGLALRNATLICAAHVRDADIVRVHGLAVGILAARWMADAVDTSLARATLRTGDAGLVVDGLGCAALVLAGSSCAAAGIAGASLLAQSVDAGSAGAALTVEHAVVRRNRRLLAQTVEALAARATVRLNATALGRRSRLRLTRVTRGVANITARAVGLLVAVTSLGTQTVRTAIAAGRAV